MMSKIFLNYLRIATVCLLTVFVFIGVTDYKLVSNEATAQVCVPASVQGSVYFTGNGAVLMKKGIVTGVASLGSGRYRVNFSQSIPNNTPVAITEFGNGLTLFSPKDLTYSGTSLTFGSIGSNNCSTNCKFSGPPNSISVAIF